MCDWMCKVQFAVYLFLPTSYHRNGGSQVCTEVNLELKEFQADKTLRQSGRLALKHFPARSCWEGAKTDIFKLIISLRRVRGDNSCHVSYRKQKITRSPGLIRKHIQIRRGWTSSMKQIPFILILRNQCST